MCRQWVFQRLGREVERLTGITGSAKKTKFFKKALGDTIQEPKNNYYYALAQ